MVVKYWGVRGSMPSPGEATRRYGGNTACVSIEIGDSIVIIGAGTGIRILGNELRAGTRRILLLLSHLHLDHVIGFPLFAPLFESGREIHIAGVAVDGGIETPLDLMDGVHWPVMPDDLKADIRVSDDAEAMLRDYGISLSTVRVNHPGGAIGFKLVDGHQTLVHIPDNELEPPGVPEVSFEALVEFCHGATVLSHDAQYLDPEMPKREGWGHSLAMSTCRLAVQARVKTLVLFHHDPDRSDDELDRVGRMAAEELGPEGIETVVAYEGLTIDLADPTPARRSKTGHSLID